MKNFLRVVLVSVCFFLNAIVHAQPATAPNQWTWAGGTINGDIVGVYGTKGIAANGNTPGGRINAAHWIDNQGNLWIMGGQNMYGGNYLSDLWKYNISTGQWMWVSGSATTNQPGVYGAKGVANATNIPGSRWSALNWTDNQGNLWLMGGIGCSTADSGNQNAFLNDVWKFNIATGLWTWMGGTMVSTQQGIHGAKGVFSEDYIPGPRQESVTWIDQQGNAWLFGGKGYEYDRFTDGGHNVILNDLWEYNTTTLQWAWMGGTDASTLVEDSSTDTTPLPPSGILGVYGTKGVAADTNLPSARAQAAGWTDASGNLWLYGGYGPISDNPSNSITDLWKYNISSGLWTWVSGTGSFASKRSTGYRFAVYGVKGLSSIANTPGERELATTWTDQQGNLWLMGGYTQTSVNEGDSFSNDLWKYNTFSNQWTWVSGSSASGQISIYGTKGTPAASNVPGARFQSLAWTDKQGNLWLMGGYGRNEIGGYLNELWVYKPGAIVPVTTPTTQSSQLKVSAITPTTATLSWMPGNGTYRIVYMFNPNIGTTPTTTGRPEPVDGASYTANPLLNSGSQIGTTGWYAIYNGTGSAVNLTNLSDGQDYTVAVVDYNGSEGNERYSTAAGGVNPFTFTTIVKSNDATLSNLTVNGGPALTPSFSSATLGYTVALPANTTSVQITPVSSSTHASITVNNIAVASGVLSQAVTIKAGVNTILIKVTAQDGSTTKTYTVRANVGIVTPAITLSTLSKIYSNPDFDPAATSTNPITPITYTSSNHAVATIVNSKVHIVGVGTSTVTASQAAGTGFNAATPVSRTLTVAKGRLTIIANDQTKTYGDANPALTLSYIGMAPGETGASLDTPPTVTTTATRNSSRGVYAIVPSGASSYNYDIVYRNGSLTVNQAGLEVTINNASRLYGAANPSAYTFTYSGFVNGDNESALHTKPKGYSAAGKASDVGDYTLTCANALAVNYTFVYHPGTLSVLPAPLVITAVNKIKTYGGAAPAYTFAYTGFKNGQNAQVLSHSPAASSDGGRISAVAGSYTITVNGASALNYSISYAPGTLMINKATLTVTAGNVSRTNGQANPAVFPLTYSGFIPGEDYNMLVTKPVASTVATNGSAVGKYTINVSGGVAANYNLIYKTGILTIIRATTAAGLGGNDVIANSISEKLHAQELSALIVHQAVSPNGDGINDYLLIEGMENYPRNTVTIVDPNGSAVYKTSGYNNTTKRFEGKNNSGVMQREGTYFYLITYMDGSEQKNKTGFVVLKGK